MSHINLIPTLLPLNVFPLLWNSQIPPKYDMVDIIITPITILKLLTVDGFSCFISPIIIKFIHLHHSFYNSTVMEINLSP